MPRRARAPVLTRWTGLEYSQRSRSLILILLAPVFLLALPALFLGLGEQLDQLMHLAPAPPPPGNLIVGIPLLLVGAALGLWSNLQLLATGRGTPLPLMPTQQLVVEPPYTWTRNPMALGAISLYLGVATVFRSLGTVIIVLLGAAALLTYIRLAEERQLTARFGPEYRDYRRATPFLFPGLRSRRRTTWSRPSP